MQFLKCLTLGLFVFSLTSCQQETLYPSFKSENTFENGVLQPAPNFTQFKELPIPENATMDLKKTIIFGHSPLIGRLSFFAPYSQTNIFDFYMQEMPRFGWSELTSIRSSQSFMTFSKDPSIASIRMEPSVRGTNIIIDISGIKNKQ